MDTDDQFGIADVLDQDKKVIEEVGIEEEVVEDPLDLSDEVSEDAPEDDDLGSDMAYFMDPNGEYEAR